MESTTSSSRRAPGPRGHWLWGSLLERRNSPLSLFYENAIKYGQIVRYRMGPLTVHMINDPDGIKHVLQENAKNYVKGFGYDQLEAFLGQGLLTSEGAFWLRQRRMAQPAFHRARIADLTKLMVLETEDVAIRWEAAARNRQTIEVAEHMMELTLAIVGRTLFGSDVSKASKTVRKAMGAMLPEANRRMLSLVRLPLAVPTPRNLRIKRAMAELDEVVYSIIDSRRAQGETGTDLLGMLIGARDEEGTDEALGDAMSNKQLRDEVMTMFLAGHETSANALAWAWYLISQHPGVEAKLHAELDQALGGRSPAFEDLPRLPYTLHVIEEALRLYPPAWIIARQAIGPDEVLGYPIEAGGVITASPYVMHRNPKFWDHPDAFDPDRFTPERSAGRPKFAYFPFGGGPRICIGNQFALTEMQLVLALLAQKFRLELVPGQTIVPDPQITLRPRDGIRMRVVARSKAQAGGS